MSVILYISFKRLDQKDVGSGWDMFYGTEVFNKNNNWLYKLKTVIKLFS